MVKKHHHTVKKCFFACGKYFCLMLSMALCFCVMLTLEQRSPTKWLEYLLAISPLPFAYFFDCKMEKYSIKERLRDFWYLDWEKHEVQIMKRCHNDSKEHVIEYAEEVITNLLNKSKK